MREQSKEIAAKLRKRISDERERQKEQVEQVKIDELRKWRDNRVTETQYHYDRIIGSALDANEEAKLEMEENYKYAQRKKELDLIAAQRGRTALRKEITDSRPKIAVAKKPKCKSIEVQTEHVSFATPAQQNKENNYAQTDSGPSRFPPEPVNCDEVVISDRSVDLLKHSKQFVEDANRRLDAISERVAYCEAERLREPIQNTAPPQSNPPVVVKLTKPIIKTTITDRMRKEIPRKPVAAPKIVNRPKKVIPSAKVPCRPTPSAESAPSRGSVACYDHPNRFTKTYDIPRNIVVKEHLATAEGEEEDDAVTNALNETLTNIEQDIAREARSKELRYIEYNHDLFNEIFTNLLLIF